MVETSNRAPASAPEKPQVRVAANNTGPKLEAVGPNSNSALLTLLRVEAEARSLDDPRKLVHLITNETRKLARARQVFVLKRSRAGSLVVEAVSSIDVVDRNTPLVRWIERLVKRLGDDSGLDALREFSLPAYCDDRDEEANTYPFRNFLWVPLQLRDGTVFAGILAAREQVWLDADNIVAKRLAGCFAHAWSALTGTRALSRAGARKKYLALTAAMLVIALMALPVPMTALAPAEIVPRDAFVVAAPIDGTVRQVRVQPNSKVKQGDALLSMEDVRLRNELIIAENQVIVAEAKLKRSSQAAFADAEARRELRLAMSELQLRKAERDYARDLMAKTSITAERTGLAVFGSAKDWIGRPVKTGEKIMEIADPGKIEVRIDLAVKDAIVLANGAPVKLFLDADPLNPISATVTQASHEAKEVASGVLSYRLTGDLAADQPLPRIGARGTAQVSGQDAALFFYLFRRPISFLRQRFGF